MDLTLIDWMAENGYDLEQARFMRDNMTALVASGLDFEEGRALCRVISEHASKGARLPVYSFARPDLGLRLVFRNNFYNWKLSVLSEHPIDVSAVDSLFYSTPPREPDYTGDELASCYFEGFPDELIFGYHSENPRRWSAEIGGTFALWSVVHAVLRSVGARTTARATTREEHRAEMDAQAARRLARVSP